MNIDLTSSQKSAIKTSLAHLDLKYGSRAATGIKRIDWKNQTYVAGEAKPRAFGLETGAREGTFRVIVAGQQAVTPRPAIKASKGQSSPASSASRPTAQTATV